MCWLVWVDNSESRFVPTTRVGKEGNQLFVFPGVRRMVHLSVGQGMVL